MVHGEPILVLGGGFGGIVAATVLRRLIPRDHRVILIEQGSRLVFSPSFLWVMVEQRSAIGSPVPRRRWPNAALNSSGEQSSILIPRPSWCASTVMK